MTIREDWIQKNIEEEDLPKLDVPDKYQPLENVSMDRKNEKYFRGRLNDD